MRAEIKEMFDQRSLPERLKIVDCLGQSLRIRTIARKDTWRDCTEIQMYSLHILGYSKRSIGRGFRVDHKTVKVRIKKAEQMIKDRFPELFER